MHRAIRIEWLYQRELHRRKSMLQKSGANTGKFIRSTDVQHTNWIEFSLPSLPAIEFIVSCFSDFAITVPFTPLMFLRCTERLDTIAVKTKIRRFKWQKQTLFWHYVLTVITDQMWWSYTKNIADQMEPFLVDINREDHYHFKTYFKTLTPAYNPWIFFKFWPQTASRWFFCCLLILPTSLFKQWKPKNFLYVVQQRLL